MAILQIFPGVSVEILINGKATTEYDDVDEVQVQHEDFRVAEYQKSRIVSKYIASETAQRFTIKHTVGAPYIRGTRMPDVSLGFYLYIDGKFVNKTRLSRIWFRGKEIGAVWEQENKGVEKITRREYTLREFVFAKIDTHSEDTRPASVERLAQRMKSVGTIEIRAFSEGGQRSGKDAEGSSQGFFPEAGARIPEVTLKGDEKSHGVA